MWRHKKSGRIYIIIDDENIFIESTGERAVIYKALHGGEKWVRPYDNFHDGRFEKINKIKYKDSEVILSVSDEF